MASRSCILLSAFACDPYFGSDEEVGWQWAQQLSSRGFDITVITRRTHQQQIQKFISETGHCLNVRFEYVDIEWLYPLTRKFNARNQIYYYFWQVSAYFRARKLHQERPFSLIHHVTWVSFRQPSFMGLIGVPLFFGPVAGGDEIPNGYTSNLAFKPRVIEAFRSLLNILVRFDPLMWLTFATAQKVYFTSENHISKVAAFVRKKAVVDLAIGCDMVQRYQKNTASIRQGNKLLFVGRCIGWKGMDIGLEIFARIHKVKPEVTLTIVGDGEEKSRWMNKADSLDLANVIEWRGWLPKAEVLKLYSEYDAFFYPSLRDSGGFAVLEAMQQGLPVVCFQLGGPGMLVDDSCGKLVIAEPDIDKTVEEYAKAVLHVLSRSVNEPELPNNCRQRAQMFTWDSLIERIYGTV